MIKDKYKNNIVAYYDFRNGIISDISGNGWNPTIAGTIKFSSRKSGRTLRTNANGDGLSLGKIYGTSAPIQNLTIVASIVPYKFNSLNRVIKKFSGGGSTAGSIIMDYNSSGVARFIVATSGAVLKIASTAASTVKVEENIVLGGVFNGSAQTVTVFANGIASTPTAFTESEIPAYDYAWEAFKEITNTGLLDCYQILILNVALTNEEMSQLYEEIKQEGNYSLADINSHSNPARTLITDGDMELSDTSAWTANNNAVLTKESGYTGLRCLRITKNVTNEPFATQGTIIPGKMLSISGYCRSDGTAIPRVFLGDLSHPLVVPSPTSTEWHYFNFVWRSKTTTTLLGLQAYTSTGGNYVEFDDVIVQEVPNIDPVYIADGSGWNEGLATTSAGLLDNTDWIVTSTGARIYNNTDFVGKYITSTSATSVIYRPYNQVYGTWECDISKADIDSQPIFMFFASNNSNPLTAGQNGYAIYLTNSDRIALYKLTGVTSTSLIQTGTSYITYNQFYKIKVTRTKAGLFTLYISADGGISYTTIGSVADTTYTDSNFSVLSFPTNSKIRNFRFLPYIE